MAYVGVILFVLSYIGIAVGRLPWLKLDRTGVALLGAMLMIVFQVIDLESAILSVDYSTMILLFGMMILSAQLRLGGFYSMIAEQSARRYADPRTFMGVLVIMAALLASVLSNDVVCLALTPVVIEITRQRHWKPLPFLLALAVSCNIGSAALLIGNPQNMYIAQRANLPFAEFLLWCLPPVMISLAALYWWARRGELAETKVVSDNMLSLTTVQPYDSMQTQKGLLVMALMIGLFFTPIPREITILGVASILLMNRKLASRQFLAYVDWALLLLFIGLFVLIEGFYLTGQMDAFYTRIEASGIDLYNPWVFSGLSVLMSNVVSNVPAVMLLMAKMPTDNHALHYLLSLTSTMAGNLILVGSVANLIVAEQASQHGITISFRDHFRWSAPVAVFSIVIAMLWWFLMATLGA